MEWPKTASASGEKVPALPSACTKPTPAVMPTKRILPSASSARNRTPYTRLKRPSSGLLPAPTAAIPVARLEAIPFARFTVDCQSRFEQENKGKNRWESAQPFMDTVESSEEEGSEESEDEEKTKAKE
jgi:Prokaryotic dksA/traR C4-type zinc finger